MKPDDTVNICAICGNAIAEDAGFRIGVSGQLYHLECVKRREATSHPPDLADDAPVVGDNPPITTNLL
jgi:hypothetical protein